MLFAPRSIHITIALPVFVQGLKPHPYTQYACHKTLAHASTFPPKHASE